MSRGRNIVRSAHYCSLTVLLCFVLFSIRRIVVIFAHESRLCMIEMTQADLISFFPKENSIDNRVLLVDPSRFRQLSELSIHECRMFLLIKNGVLTVRTGNDQTVVDSNHLIDMLVWEPVTFVDMSEDLQAWCLLPNYLFTNESLNELKPTDSESFKDRHSMPILPLEPSETAVLERQLELLLNALNDMEHIYRAELCRTYFRSFMLEAGNIVYRKRETIDDSEVVENRQDAILRGFLKLVWKYYRTEHNIGFYAGRLCLSAKHLSRVVSTKLGKTPYAVIRDELLQRAAYLLKDTKTPVQDISSELHFSELAAFCKFFHKHNGMSPTAYRAVHQKIN